MRGWQAGFNDLEAQVAALKVERAERAMTLNQWHAHMDAKDARIQALEAALGALYVSYCREMAAEYDYPGRPWTPDRDNDEAAIQAREALKVQA